MTNINHPAMRQPKFRRRARPSAEPSITQPIPASVPPASYEVGYGKPPKQHRFKPGTSGNPKGRPKGARGINAIARKILHQETELTLRGKRRKVAYIEALLLKQLELASKGEQRALTELLKLYRTAVPDQDDDKVLTGAEIVAPASDDEDPILAAYRALILAEITAEQERKA